MATVNLPFAASGSRRAPNSGELADGLPCGPLDVELFNWLFWYAPGQIAEVIRDAGMTPDDADLSQLTEAIRRLGLLPDAMVYSSAGSSPWVAPAGITRVKARVVGAGGGGGAAGSTGGAGGGGGGGYGEGIYTVTPGNSYTVTVGAGGAGGTSAGNGGAGGTSSFSTRISVTGGQGGYGISSGYQVSNAAGGISTDGRLNLPGGRGSNALPAPTNWIGGQGGSCPMVGTPAPYAYGPAWAGQGPGGGGSAPGTVDGTARNGGAGFDGLVILEW